MRLLTGIRRHRIAMMAMGVLMAAAAGAVQASVTVDITSSTNFNDLTASGGDITQVARIYRSTGSLVTSNNWVLTPNTVLFHDLTPAPTAPYGVAVGGTTGFSTVMLLIGSNFEFDVHGVGIDLSLNSAGGFDYFPTVVNYYVYDEAGNSLSALNGSVTIEKTVVPGESSTLDAITGAHVGINSPNTAIGQVKFKWYSAGGYNRYDLLFDNIYLNPEPTSLSLLAAGVLGLATRRRRRC